MLTVSGLAPRSSEDRHGHLDRCRRDLLRDLVYSVSVLTLLAIRTIDRPLLLLVPVVLSFLFLSLRTSASLLLIAVLPRRLDKIRCKRRARLPLAH